jgi:hypothetical protein
MIFRTTAKTGEKIGENNLFRLSYLFDKEFGLILEKFYLEFDEFMLKPSEE